MKIIAVVFCLMLNAGCSDNDDLTEEPSGPVHNENISIGSGNPELILAWKENTGYTVTIAGWGQKYIPVDEAIVCLEVFPVGVQSSKWYRAADQEAEKIIANAHKTIDLEREKTVQDLQTQIAGLAMMAAGKVLGKADAAEQNKLMYEQFLAKTGGCNDTDSK